MSKNQQDGDRRPPLKYLIDRPLLTRQGVGKVAGECQSWRVTLESEFLR
jgi:hypothetical protein